jgi:hypothetical protein
MSSQIKLQQPVINGSLRSTNFFNGRLVTGADMNREQTARREGDRRIGRAAGDGIVYGLEVEKAASAGNDPIISVTKGLAVNRCGQSLFLSQDTTVNLLQRFGASEQPSKIFGDCQPLQGGTYTAGYGLYLLVLSPVESSEGSAPTSGLNNAFSTCGTDVILETVQFRLLAVDPFLKNETLPDGEMLRNFLAYKCFGIEEAQDFFADPFNFSLETYGLIDGMRGQTLGESDVPLAIINWTSAGLRFVEMWAVRRRVTDFADDDDWTQLIGDRRLSEAEAMLRQFAVQIEDLLFKTANPQTLTGDDHFRYLPSAGILPLKTSGTSHKGFNADTFFGGRVPDEIVSTDGDRLRVLLRESLSHEPIDLFGTEDIQFYYVRENLQAINAGEKVQKVLVFARHSLPFFGVARFDEATFENDRFSAPVK